MAHLFVLENSKRHILLCGQYLTAPLTSPCSVVYLLIQMHYITQGGALSLNFCALSTAKGMELIMKQTGHRSENMVCKHIRMGSLLQENASAMVGLQNIVNISHSIERLIS
jgi:hypothetical protein